MNSLTAFDKLIEAIQSYEEMERFYIERTNAHIALVNDAIDKIVRAYPEYRELLARGDVHDQSKFEDPERVPYVYVTWGHKSKKEGVPFKVPEGMEAEMHKATQHHVLTNKHHPEYWAKDKSQVAIDAKDRNKLEQAIDVSAMPPIDIAEMVADWQAMSWELQTNTARQWYDKQKKERWLFTAVQDNLIDKLLKVFKKEAGNV